MTTIVPGQHLQAAVHGEIAALRERQAAQGGAARKRPSAAGSASSLATVVAQRVAGIAPEDPQRRQKAFRVFLESALLHELGPTLVHDAGFPAMVDAVQARLQADTQLAKAAEELAGYLLSPAAR